MCRYLLLWSLLMIPAPAARSEDRLAYDYRIDLPVTLGAAGFIVGTEAWKRAQGLEECRWCDSNALDGAVRERLRWSDDHAANWASDITGFGVLPLTAAGTLALAARQGKRPGEMPANVLIVTESTLLAGIPSQSAKILVGRERPFVHDLSEADKTRTGKPHDNNASFYSGHASASFAIAVSSGTVASLRGYEAAPWVWGGGLAVAATVPYFRIAADRHYFTDVLAGALMGSAVGFSVPYFLHRRAPDAASRMRFALRPAPGGGDLIIQWTW